ncbi:MAG: polysaccharide deacetylase family protein [Firmicutes bacterium]|nr:polysaccharide deacetylase family protein [Bacillota bacterium]
MTEEESPKSTRFKRTSRFKRPKAAPEAMMDAPAAGGAEGPPPAPSALPVSAPPVADSPIISDLQPDIPEVVEEQPIFTEAAKVNVLTIDVKEWFQTEAFSDIIKFSHWSKYERRVERGVHLILALLRQHNIKATFFVLGIVAREFPELVRLLSQEGHEIGVCGYYNRRLYSIPPADYISELEMSLTLLKSLTGKNVTVHRAPGWSVTANTLWVLDVLQKYGIKYDSSIYPVKAPLYGIDDAPSVPYVINPHGITEFPPGVYNFMGKKIAMFGGTYLRILPYNLISMGLQSVNRQGDPVLFHISPWEMEGEIPQVNLGWDGFLAQYAGLKTTFSKISRILNEYKFDTLTNVLKENPPNEGVHLKTLQRGRIV